MRNALHQWLYDWWYGIDPSRMPPPESDDEPDQAEAPDHERIAPELMRPVPGFDRIEFLRAVWGDGNAAPTEKEFFNAMYNQLALNKSMSVLDVGDGFAGAAVHMAKEYKTYVDAHVSNPAYVEPAERYAEARGVRQHVHVHPYDLSNFHVSKTYDAASFRRTLWRVPDIATFVATCNKALKERGHLVLADYVAPESAMNNPLMKQWYADEHYVTRIDLEGLQATLNSAGFLVRVADDMTTQHVAEIKRGIARIAEYLKGRKLNPDSQQLVMKEAERWALRAQLLGQAGLRFYRFYAQKK